ncbi:MAG: nucleoside-diphosphate sugar epimerase/dehydratase [Acidimicrobiia bacterium]|jgi:FlaA1/EpsC-like NDP-sugar epimerase
MDSRGETRWVALSRRASRVRTDITFAVIDALVVMAAYSTALALRMLDPLVEDGATYWSDLLRVLPVIIIVHILANALAGAYGHVWEYASINEATRLALANGAATAVIVVLEWLGRHTMDLLVPYLTLIAGGLFTFLLTGLLRFRSRLFSFKKSAGGPSVLVVGRGVEAAAFARRLSDIEGGGHVVGFVNDRNGGPKSSRLVADLPVLGSLEDIPSIVTDQSVDQVVVAGVDPDTVRSVVDSCLEIDVRLRILPGVEDIVTDRTAPLDVRDIKVEDLLVRDAVHTDMANVADLIRDKRVLVTGAGGSIGSEIVRQILSYESAEVWALDRDETLLHEAQITWGNEARVMLCDVRQAEAVLRALELIKPELIFHAAALKHVPMLERFPDEAALTNVVGTRNMIEAGSRVGAERFVLISTDKAVDPNSVMGASKRAAELLVKTGNARNDGCTYTAVRFGNVLGSRGSVIPTFVSQIRAGGPVTVTDPRMKRYFMTVNEAVQLVLQAASLATGSEIYLLDMGEPVFIDDLARRLIRLAGLIPDVDIAIEYTGVRPGEKLEEVLANGPVDVTSNPKIFEARLSQPGGGVVAEAVADIEEAANMGDIEMVIDRLNELVWGLPVGGPDLTGLAMKRN